MSMYTGQMYESMKKVEAAREANTVLAVSYTHLDVYKRQSYILSSAETLKGLWSRSRFTNV